MDEDFFFERDLNWRPSSTQVKRIPFPTTEARTFLTREELDLIYNNTYDINSTLIEPKFLSGLRSTYESKYQFKAEQCYPPSTSNKEDGSRKIIAQTFRNTDVLFKHNHFCVQPDHGLLSELRTGVFTQHQLKVLQEETQLLQDASKVSEKRTKRGNEYGIHAGYWRRYTNDIFKIKGTDNPEVQEWIKALHEAGIWDTLNQYLFESLPGMFQQILKIAIPDGERRYFGVYTAVAVNFDFSCLLHQDYKDSPFTHCITVTFGDFNYENGGHLCLRDIFTIYEMKPGSVAQFKGRTIRHESLKYNGKRFCIVLFVDANSLYKN
ncbi:hypothetical protein AKO1_003123 [Acrasis kona]|uniref:Uncharacterized protein n=1 Tax=Acrasis kona TaxID=1008807 RepID=A0AAW2Z6T5_9EUKA